MTLSADERETVISITDADPVAHVYTAQRRWITRLKKNPAAALIDEGIHDGSPWARFEIDKSLFTVRSKRGTGRGNPEGLKNARAAKTLHRRNVSELGDRAREMRSS